MISILTGLIFLCMALGWVCMIAGVLLLGARSGKTPINERRGSRLSADNYIAAGLTAFSMAVLLTLLLVWMEPIHLFDTASAVPEPVSTL